MADSQVEMEKQKADAGDSLDAKILTESTVSNDAVDARTSKSSNGPARVATMPVAVDAVYYNFNHPKRGSAVVFNHEYFDIKSLKPRSGTNVDRDNLKQTLSHLGFDVFVYDDLNCTDVMKTVQKFADADHSDCDCLVVALLSHGEQGILYAKDVPYKPEALWNPFTADKCPTLAGKPKLFFIQACQGDKLDPGITLTQVDGNPLQYKIPTQADFLIAYSTVPGYYSWRNTTYGSWFMQALCFELKRRGKEENILTIMTFVCQRVAFDFESNCPLNVTMHCQKQIPCITTMLTRLLQFNKK